MANKNYNKGAAKERALVNAARARGYIAFRSAGSHSPVDVVMINPILHIISLVQCKPKTMSQNAKDKLLAEHPELNGTFMVEFIIL